MDYKIRPNPLSTHASLSQSHNTPVEQAQSSLDMTHLMDYRNREAQSLADRATVERNPSPQQQRISKVFQDKK